MSSGSMDEFPDTDRPRKRSKHAHIESRPDLLPTLVADELYTTQYQEPLPSDKVGHSPTNGMAAIMIPLDGFFNVWTQESLADGSSFPLTGANTSFSSEDSIPNRWAASSISGPPQLGPEQPHHHALSAHLASQEAQPSAQTSSRRLPPTDDDLTGHASPTTPLEPQYSQRPNYSVVSPFKDCVGSFGKYDAPTFPRPFDGKVDGYVKFNWPKNGRRPSTTSQQPHPRIIELPDDKVTPNSVSDGTSPAQQTPRYGHSPATSPFSHGKLSPEPSPNLSSITSTAVSRRQSPSLGPDLKLSPDTTWVSLAQGYGSLSPMVAGLTTRRPLGNPQYAPKYFGMEARMDNLDRKLWSFYIQNWCPGRSILKETNLWEKDFALMQRRDGVRAAIQSLAGIYIHDYTPNDLLLRRVNDRFAEAESRLTQLLNDPSCFQMGRGSEVITLAVILSMQDIVLTERRLKKPFAPRWLVGFRQAEYFLDRTDSGARYWDKDHAQLDSLGLSQAIIVGRAVILAQPMIPLTHPAKFEPQREVKRFGWLLYGTKQEMYEIHGGCGFSKKLLHLISQVTYCAARLQQEPESMVTPMTAEYILQELQEMRQWSRESRSWEQAKEGLQKINEVKTWPTDYVLYEPGQMTEVTAEAWRIAAIIYLQCRLLRLPRNDPQVLESLSELAACIRVMPTSGQTFTAQAPLFPVFLLGVLSCRPDLRQISQNWFEQVVMTPVRSSVPPLYKVLQRIWNWIDDEVELPEPGTTPERLVDRDPWWEQMVSKVEETEEETLCLT